MEQKQRIEPVRVAALLAVLALHVLLFAPTLHLRTWQFAMQTPQPALKVFWLEPQVPISNRAPIRKPPSPSRRRPTDRSLPITSKPITVEPSETPPRIDWNAQAGDAARDYVRQQEELARQRNRFAPREPRTGLESKEKLDAGWNEYRFKRVESQPGGTVIHLSERCAIAITGFIFPVCQLGKLKGRREMYERMKQWQRDREGQNEIDLP